MKKVNRTGGKVRYKPGERRNIQKSKGREQNFPQQNFQDQFPQLGEGSSKAPKVVKHPKPVDPQRAPTDNKSTNQPKGK